MYSKVQTLYYYYNQFYAEVITAEQSPPLVPPAAGRAGRAGRYPCHYSRRTETSVHCHKDIIGAVDCLKHSAYCMYRQFNIQQFYVPPTQCIYVFCVDLRTNSDYFTVQH